MRCPICVEVSLVMSDRQGIEVDYCPQCRGVWLDRGELDKIIERSAAPQSPLKSPPETMSQQIPQQMPAQWNQPPAPVQPRQPARDEWRRDDDDDDRYDPRRKKRGGFLGELFDFD